MFSEINNENNRAKYHLVAHRGYSQHFPENTLLAIQGALDAGAKYIEIDIQLSADKQAVVFHDRDLNRLCQQPKAIHDYELSQLKTFSSYSPERFGEQYKGEKIATLNEVVTLLENYPDVTLFVELKRISISYHGIDEMLQVVLSCLNSILDQCVLISFSLEILESLRSQVSLPIGAVIDDWNDALTIHHERLQVLAPNYFFCDIDTLPIDGPLKLLNSKIVTYECTNTEQAVSALHRGVDFIETFDIEMMINEIDRIWREK